MGRLIACSGLGANVPGCVPGFAFSKAAPIQGRSGRSGRSDSRACARNAQHLRPTAPIKSLAHDKYTRNTRNTWNKPVKTGLADVPSPERNPEHLPGARNIMAKPLRDTMPTVSGFIDDMRDAFGAAEINASIRAGMEGQPTFYACENGVEVGAKDTRPGIRLTDMVIDAPGAIVAVGRGRK